MYYLKPYIEPAIEIAKEAGALIRTAFHDRSLQGPFGAAEFKTSAADLVTATDRAVEQLVFTRLRALFPDHAFVGEESYDASEKKPLSDQPTWVVDPVDGTTNFVHGLPFVAVSIALLVEKEPIVGVVYNPILDELYHAGESLGAYLNGTRLPLHQVAPTVPAPTLATSLLATEYGYERDAPRVDAKVGAVRSLLVNAKARSIRSLGSAALEACLVARGTFDAWWEAGVHMWDVAAAAIIVREAGGVAVNFAPRNTLRRRAPTTGPAGTADVTPTREFLDVADRRFVFVRGFGEGREAEQDAYVRELRSHLAPIDFERD